MIKYFVKFSSADNFQDKKVIWTEISFKIIKLIEI